MTKPASRSRRFGALAALALASSLLSLLATKAPAASAQPAGATDQSPEGSTSAAPIPLRVDEEPLGVPAAASPAALALQTAGEHEHRPSVTHQAQVAPFVAIGFSWSGAPGHVEVRVRFADGTWSSFAHLEATPDHGQDGAAGTRRVTDPLTMTGSATAYEVMVPEGATDVRAHLVREDPGATQQLEAPQSATLTPAAAADGLPGPDGIRSRAAWGARERKQTSGCGDGSHREGRGCVADAGVLHAVVHHTVHANDYGPGDVPGILRAMQAFHMDANGWDDLGYNFVVDKFGTVWEGRAGGPDRPVVGGHTAGFNTDSVGVAVLGTFTSAAPTDAAVEGVARTIAWKLAPRNIDPLGTTVLTSRGGGAFPAGTRVNAANISGHRDLGQTSCPGTQLYDRLPQIRTRVAQLLPLFTGEVTDTWRFNGQLQISGFALRRDSAAPVSVRIDIDGNTVATVSADRGRLDVGARWGALGPNHGFEVTVPVTLAMRTACVFEVSSGTLIGCRDVNPVTPPFGVLDLATGATGPPRIAISGWVIDPDDPGPTPLHVYIDGVHTTTVWTGVARPDVAAAFPRYGNSRGFAATIPTTIGAHDVCVYAINVPADGGHPLLACRRIIVGSVDQFVPVGALDAVMPEGQGARVVGWAHDGDTTAPVVVHVYADGTFVGSTTTTVPRPDVAAAIPGAGATRGYSAWVALAPGNHTVCTYALNHTMAGPNPLLGCRGVNVPVPRATPPTGVLDVVTPSGQGILVAGWAADPDSADPLFVHVYVDRNFNTMTANQPRPDVGAAIPSFGPNRGFVGTVPAGPGAHQVCVYAINDNLVGPHQLLGCRTVVVQQPNAARPFGAVDAVIRTGGVVRVAGWAIDPDTDAPIAVHIYVGAAGTAVLADVNRPDVAAAVPGHGPRHGFDVTLPVPPGASRVCAYGINDNFDAGHTTLGCAAI
ncbi:MAG TPA: N-acetylmuramoyl-L-alanine amidase [Acidimicrobiales bacterium]